MNGKMAKRLRKAARTVAEQLKVPEDSTQTRISDGARVRRDKRQVEQMVKTNYKDRRRAGGDATRISLPVRVGGKPTEVDRVTSTHGRKDSRFIGRGGHGADRIRAATLGALRTAPVSATEAGQADPGADRSREARPADSDRTAD